MFGRTWTVVWLSKMDGSPKVDGSGVKWALFWLNLYVLKREPLFSIFTHDRPLFLKTVHFTSRPSALTSQCPLYLHTVHFDIALSAFPQNRPLWHQTVRIPLRQSIFTSRLSTVFCGSSLKFIFIFARSKQTSADSTVRILSGFTVQCLSVKIKFKFEIWTLENHHDWKIQILTDRHRTVNPDRIRTALSADVCYALRSRRYWINVFVISSRKSFSCPNTSLDFKFRLSSLFWRIFVCNSHLYSNEMIMKSLQQFKYLKNPGAEN